MTYAQQVWQDNVTPVDKAHMDHIEAGIAAVESGLVSGKADKPSYGTTLPGSPADGQEAILVDSITAPNWQWRFRYNAGHSSDAFKWEFIGGTEQIAQLTSDEGLVLDTAWHLFPTNISVVVPRAGFYVVYASARFYVAAAASLRVSIGFGVNVTATSASADSYGTEANSLSFRLILGPFAAGDRVNLSYAFGAAPTTAFGSQKFLSAIPVRVA